MDAVGAYQCDVCGNVWAEYVPAKTCCRKVATRGFACMNCGDFYSYETDAEACCVDDEAVDEPIYSAGEK